MSLTCPQGHSSQSEDYCDVCGTPMAPAAGAAGNAPTGGGWPGGGPDSGIKLAKPAAGGGSGATQTCPHCQMQASADALFCEQCGYDFVTGEMPIGAEEVSASSPWAAGPVPAPTEVLSPPPGVPPAPPAATEQVASVPSAAPASAGTPSWVAEVWVDPQWFAEQEASSTEPCPSVGPPALIPLTKRSLLIGRVSISRNIHPDIDCSTDSGVSRRHAQLTTDGARWFVEDLQSSNGTFVGKLPGVIPDNPIAPGPKTELASGDRLYVGAWTRIVVREVFPGEV